jgi:hypothetical protein
LRNNGRTLDAVWEGLVSPAASRRDIVEEPVAGLGAGGCRVPDVSDAIVLDSLYFLSCPLRC